MSKRVERADGELWSAIRTLLEQGAAIQQDYASGKYEDYEHYSARLDQAARERIDWLKERASLLPQLGEAATTLEMAKRISQLPPPEDDAKLGLLIEAAKIYVRGVETKAVSA